MALAGGAARGRLYMRHGRGGGGNRGGNRGRDVPSGCRGAPICLVRAAQGRGGICIIVLEVVRLPLVLAVGSDVGLGAQQRSRCGIFGV